ncbi:hypothetical protein F3Y22_tig00111215pilonHSYRG00061 [Hibiscus syriacus]|uniref:Uncharacterized protein n=1 Tax=Hibiscus syriacus TaxID=106335 RepID=A0A6A2YVM9_HIBSY|nr:hypothetical protein F3Y22_tig00111215pilonHSYRG00061 [Hibiscus syriacus]
MEAFEERKLLFVIEFVVFHGEEYAGGGGETMRLHEEMCQVSEGTKSSVLHHAALRCHARLLAHKDLCISSYQESYIRRYVPDNAGTEVIASVIIKITVNKPPTFRNLKTTVLEGSVPLTPKVQAKYGLCDQEIVSAMKELDKVRTAMESRSKRSEKLNLKAAIANIENRENELKKVRHKDLCISSYQESYIGRYVPDNAGPEVITSVIIKITINNASDVSRNLRTTVLEGPVPLTPEVQAKYKLCNQEIVSAMKELDKFQIAMESRNQRNSI